MSRLTNVEAQLGLLYEKLAQFERAEILTADESKKFDLKHAIAATREEIAAKEAERAALTGTPRASVTEPSPSPGGQNVGVNAPTGQVFNIQNLYGNVTAGGAETPPGASAAARQASTGDADALKTLNAIADNENFIRQLREKVNKNAVVPFVGAGLSMPFGMPSWKTFLFEAGKDHKRRITNFLKQNQYEEAAQFLLNEVSPQIFHSRLNEAFSSAKVSGANFDGEAVGVLPRLVSGPVVTTNFDKVLEKTFEAAGRPFQKVVIGGDKTDWVAQAVQNHEAFLLKIHGDVEDRTERILTVDDYRKHYGEETKAGRVDFEKPLPKHLRLMMGAKSLLFLGCSLETDRLMAVLRQITQDTPGVKHYAIVAKPKVKKKFNERLRELGEAGIHPIWYPDGRYDLIQSLLGHLAAGREGVRP